MEGIIPYISSKFYKSPSDWTLDHLGTRELREGKLATTYGNLDSKRHLRLVETTV
jgi:hypothetical protein